MWGWFYILSNYHRCPWLSHSTNLIMVINWGVGHRFWPKCQKDDEWPVTEGSALIRVWLTISHVPWWCSCKHWSSSKLFDSMLARSDGFSASYCTLLVTLMCWQFEVTVMALSSEDACWRTEFGILSPRLCYCSYSEPHQLVPEVMVQMEPLVQLHKYSSEYRQLFKFHSYVELRYFDNQPFHIQTKVSKKIVHSTFS